MHGSAPVVSRHCYSPAQPLPVDVSAQARPQSTTQRVLCLVFIQDTHSLSLSLTRSHVHTVFLMHIKLLTTRIGYLRRTLHSAGESLLRRLLLLFAPGVKVVTSR